MELLAAFGLYREIRMIICKNYMKKIFKILNLFHLGHNPFCMKHVYLSKAGFRLEFMNSKYVLNSISICDQRAKIEDSAVNLDKIRGGIAA